MNKRFLVVLMFAALLSGAGSFILYRLMTARPSEKAAPAVEVLVATKALRTGVMITEQDVRPTPWTGPVPLGVAMNKEDIIGRGVISTILAGEPIAEARLAAKGAGAGLAATIPSGMRAVAIRVNDVTSLAGFVVPGMKVDVLMSAKPPSQSVDPSTGRQVGDNTITKTILQNVEVLSAGTNVEPDAEGKPIAVTVINVLVTPEQAEALSLASAEARIQLVLRNPTDTEVVKTPGTAVTKLLFPAEAKKPEPAGSPRPRKPAPAQPAQPRWEPAVRLQPAAKAEEPFTVEIIHGNKKLETAFNEKSGGTN
jgi:pilus assembly protein CpaB